ncbi:MAG: poly-beta-hydroxybutyrate polymerase N-terminal domain-containing protein, partial [Pseudomonadota bacterium]
MTGAEALDRALHAQVARLTGGLSPAMLAEAQLDWALHLAMSPGKQLALTQKAARKLMRFWGHVARRMMGEDAPPCIEPLPQDRRFDDAAWRTPPWSFFYQGFLLTQQWWHNATTSVPGVSETHERVLEFAAR